MLCEVHSSNIILLWELVQHSGTYDSYKLAVTLNSIQYAALIFIVNRKWKPCEMKISHVHVLCAALLLAAHLGAGRTMEAVKGK